MLRVFGAGLLLALALLDQAFAADLHLVVIGSIEIDTNGHVTNCQVQSKNASEAVKAAVIKNMRLWTFEPVIRNGVAVPARSNVNLMLAATPVGGNYEMRIEKVRFFGGRGQKNKKNIAPHYPVQAAKAGLNGNVLLAVQVDAQGKVLNVTSVQSSLLVINTPEQVMRPWRQLFEKASEDAARKWEFEPADIARGDEPLTTLIIPVSFRVSEVGHEPPPVDQEGWLGDKAGPVREIPWLAADRQEFDATGLQEGQVMALERPPVNPTVVLVGTVL